MDVSIIIVNYNTATLTLNAIESIYRNTQNLDFEIIIADNNSKEDCDIITQHYPNVRLIKLPENVGFGRANNEGLRCANGRNILFLNPDTITTNNVIKVMSDYLDNTKDAGACGSNLFNADGEPTHSFKRIFPSIFLEISNALGGIPAKLIYGKNTDFNHTGKPVKCAYVCGADLMVKKSLLDQIGGFDKDIFMYYEDTLLCYNINSLGFNVMSLPDTGIIHLEGKSFSVNADREQRIFDGRRVFFNKVYSKRYVSISNTINRILYYTAYLICNILGKEQRAQKYKFIHSLYKNNR